MKKPENRKGWQLLGMTAVAFLLFFGAAGSVLADVPGKLPPRGMIPNPGTQEQELPSLNSFGPSNIF